MLRFSSSVWIQAPVEKVWAFHEREDVFTLLEPRVRVVARKGSLRTGSRVEFRVPVMGPLRMRWLSLHVDHEDGHFFKDEQIAGPFRKWWHEHRFEEENGGTRLTDIVHFSLPMGPVTDWIFGWLVKLRLAIIFSRRHKVTKQHCEREPAVSMATMANV